MESDDSVSQSKTSSKQNSFSSKNLHNDLWKNTLKQSLQKVTESSESLSDSETSDPELSVSANHKSKA